MEDYNLDPIFEYHMSEEEALAYKIGLYWMELSTKLFPDLRSLARYPKKGDPRKGSLFRYAYTVMKKINLKPEEYKLYITAQLQMLKSIEIGNLHPHIVPACLLGDKAWTRWQIWKSKFEKVNKTQSVKDVKTNFNEIKLSLNKTKKFLDSKFEHKEENFKAKEVERWISLNLVCGFYAAMSPWVAKYCNLGDIDLNYYKNFDKQAIDYFKELFNEI